MTDDERLKDAAQKATIDDFGEENEGWYDADIFNDTILADNEIEFIAAAKPQLILSLIARVERAEEENKELQWKLDNYRMSRETTKPASEEP